MKRIMAALAVFLAVGATALAGEAREKPNIVFILADDLGWTDLGCFGSKYYETPHIDKLARQGMKFTSAYTCGPNCAPTRACLVSGRYGPRHGVYTVGGSTRGQEQYRQLIPVENKTDLPLSEVTIADAMKSAGYATGMFGKWHLGESKQYHPGRRGFDEAISLVGPVRWGYFGFKTNPPTQSKPGTYLPDLLTEKALEFIDKHQAHPFFLYLPHFSVHSPFEAKKPLIEKYKQKEGVGGHNDPVYAAMIDSLDESVGRIMDKLDALNLSDNTIVIFYSDNGGLGEVPGLQMAATWNRTSNRPLRGRKGMLYEGGVRVPMIVRYPGVVEPGSVCAEPVISVDFYPTLLDSAGSEGDPKHKLDGVSLMPLLKSGGQGKLEREAIYWHFPAYLQANEKRGTWRTTPAGAIRSGDYKLIEFFETRGIELYHLKDDIGESHNLADEMPEVARSLHEKLVAWRESVNAPMPTRREGEAPAEP